MTEKEFEESLAAEFDELVEGLEYNFKGETTTYEFDGTKLIMDGEETNFELTETTFTVNTDGEILVFKKAK